MAHSESIDKWYVQLMGLEQGFGPMSVADLRCMVSQGELVASDRVRLGADGEWLPASTIDGLFPSAAQPPPPSPVESSPVNEPTTASEPAAETASEIDLPDDPSSERFDDSEFHNTDGLSDGDYDDLPRDDNPREPAPFSPPVRDPLAPDPSPTGADRQGFPRLDAPRADIAMPVGRTPSRQWSIPDLRKLVVLGAVAIGVWLVATRDTDTQEIYARFSEIWAGTQSQKLSDDDWADYSNRESRVVRRLVAELSDSADLTRPARLELLYAGRDHLLVMLRSKRPPRAESGQRFLRHLIDAAQLIGTTGPVTDEDIPAPEEWLEWAEADPPATQ